MLRRTRCQRPTLTGPQTTQAAHALRASAIEVISVTVDQAVLAETFAVPPGEEIPRYRLELVDSEQALLIHVAPKVRKMLRWRRGRISPFGREEITRTQPRIAVELSTHRLGAVLLGEICRL